MKKVIAAVIGAAIGFATASAADLGAIEERGVLRVAVANLAPFIITEKSGAMRGFEIDATTALAEHLGLEVEYVERPFCELADAVLEGEADIIASGYSNTELRRRLLDFSLPYHDTEYFLVISKDAARRAKTMRGINREDITIGYQVGGVSGQVAQGDFSGADLKGYSSFTEIVKDLKKGAIDGAVMFSPYQEMVVDLKLKRIEYMIPHEFALTRTIEAFAMEKGAEDLRDVINAWVIEQDLAGYWDALEAKWFDPKTDLISAPPPHACAATAAVQ